MGITRRQFLETAAVGLSGLAAPTAAMAKDEQRPSAVPASLASLYAQFQNPDRRYSIRPFWFWNGKLEGAELARQIKQMVDHGVYGAYAHNRDGLETPYLSEAWWSVLGEALKAARDNGFSLCMVDEFEWPSGEARDYWMPGINKSRVVAANPDFHMHRLKPAETPVRGLAHARIPLPARPVAVVMARQVGYESLDGDSLKTLPFDQDAKEIEWDAPAGDWIVFTYGVERAIGQPDHGTVDLMSREAIAKYIEIYYEEFHRRYGEFFGHAMPATFADHEGDYGAKLPWTPRLLETFRRKAGYDLEPNLPALTYDIGSRTEKVRCDLLDAVSELYSNNFFKQVTDWCREHHIDHSGHVWEESLFFGPSEQGDFFRIQRSMSNPGCDTLVEWGRQSVWLKEVASVADFEGRHVVCENQGVQGEGSCLTPQAMKRVSNCLGAWNIGEFIPHAFDYDLSRINFPPDWFRSQPYLPWFRAYADLMRRISFMNRESRHVADILLLYPQVSIWGQSAPAFRDEDFSSMMANSSWSEDAAETNSQYAELKIRLTDARLDFKCADDAYMAESRAEGGVLRIRDSEFRILVLPPMSTIRRSTAERVRDFFQSGGTVIALRRLPKISAESGRDDATLKQIWAETFDVRPTRRRWRLKKNAAGGRAYFVPESSPAVLEAIRRTGDPDVVVRGGPEDHLYVLHKVKAGAHCYWIVNDTAEPRINMLSLQSKGRPERWDAQTGTRSPLFYQTENGRTLVRLALGPWDAAYVVFDATGPTQPLPLSSTNAQDFYVEKASGSQVTVRVRTDAGASPIVVALKDGANSLRAEYQARGTAPLEITGPWQVTVEGGEIPLPYAMVLDDPDDKGLAGRWYAGKKKGWSALWLSPMNCAFREWNVIGPFPNPQDEGFEEHYLPEQGVDYDAIYAGEDGRRLRWLRVNAADYHAVSGGGFGLGTTEILGGLYSDQSFIVNYGEPLRASPLSGTAYAQANVYSPLEGEAVVILATSAPRAVFLNGSQVYSRWLRPLYNLLTDGFATRVPVRLQAGWNNLLLKFLHNPENPTGPEFTCRIETPQGELIPGLFAASRTFDDPAEGQPGGYRWLRFDVPGVARAFKTPPLKNSWLAFVDKEQVAAQNLIPLPRGSKAVTLRVAADEILSSPFALTTATVSIPLSTWKIPGLEYFSGRMIYEKNVNVPASLLGERVLLDCGDVSAVAEAWVNEAAVGSCAWAPYRFDVTAHLRAGANHLKIRIANTAGNARAVGADHGNLENIARDGWRGPARLVPYIDRSVQCRQA